MSIKNIHQLFCQLGYAASDVQIDLFVAHHRLIAGQELAKASFWTPGQAAFLVEAFALDAEWSGAADDLAVRLSPD
jgi:Protein of unknown function (DUF2789)